MTSISDPPRPSVEGEVNKLCLAGITTPAVADQYLDVLGADLVAYIAGVRETRAVQQYADDSPSPRHPSIEPRLRLALRVAMLISKHESKEIAQAWFMGLNPQLNDRSPARLLLEGDIDEIGPEILAAARAFLVGE